MRDDRGPQPVYDNESRENVHTTIILDFETLHMGKMRSATGSSTPIQNTPLSCVLRLNSPPAGISDHMIKPGFHKTQSELDAINNSLAISSQ